MLADYALGWAVQLTAMYAFGPIVTAWCAHRRDAILVALLAAMCNTALQLQNGSLTAQPAPLLLAFGFRFLAMAGIAVLVSQVRAMSEKFADMSMHDELTGLPNRRALVERFEVEISRARRYSIPLSLIYADVDFFKSVNDRYGHSTGDELLIRIAEALELTLRPTDIAARMGGDEFVIVLPETAEPGARALAKRLEEELVELEEQYGAGLSLGIAAFPTAPDSVGAALSAADQDMYAVKRAREATRLQPV